MPRQEGSHSGEHHAQPSPATYPQTDADEADAIVLFRSQLDSTRVKADIKERDKHPNVDGYIELVGPERAPIGKLEVQVRKIPKDATKYSCPTSLYAYSKRTALPVLLVCVDTARGLVYWKHVRYENIQGRESQDTVTVHFSSPQDLVSKEGEYYIHWERIAHDYCQRIQKYEELQRIATVATPIAGERSDTIARIQSYIDELNILLDRDFTYLKRYLFPGIWKIGFGLQRWDESHIKYVLYSVEEGRNDPLIKQIPENFPILRGEDTSFYAHYGGTDFAAAPKQAARKFVLGKLEQLAEKNLFSLENEYLCREYLFAYIDDHRQFLGIDDADVYSPEALHRAFYFFLPRWCAIALARLPYYPPHLAHFDPAIARLALRAPIKPDTVRALDTPIAAHAISLGSSRYSYRQVYALVDYAARAMEYVRRIHPRPSSDARGRWVWSGYSDVTVRKHVTSLLELFPSIYDSFLRLNEMSIQELQLTEGLVHCFVPANDTDDVGPQLHSYSLGKDAQGGNPPATAVTFGQPFNPICERDGNAWIELAGRRFRLFGSHSGSASWMFQKHPMLALVLRTLLEKLRGYLGD
ncbi:MAG: DUF4365 domain-containing protein [Candidatus Eisenbacteria sp.]|nr:DUF4365 domain-containing protein [Candidatus Eisenbacteria bacterium]